MFVQLSWRKDWHFCWTIHCFTSSIALILIKSAFSKFLHIHNQVQKLWDFWNFLFHPTYKPPPPKVVCCSIFTVFVGLFHTEIPIILCTTFQNTQIILSKSWIEKDLNLCLTDNNYVTRSNVKLWSEKI